MQEVCCTALYPRGRSGGGGGGWMGPLQYTPCPVCGQLLVVDSVGGEGAVWEGNVCPTTDGRWRNARLTA